MIMLSIFVIFYTTGYFDLSEMYNFFDEMYSFRKMEFLIEISRGKFNDWKSRHYPRENESFSRRIVKTDILYD